jgi:hypothetical protein
LNWRKLSQISSRTSRRLNCGMSANTMRRVDACLQRQRVLRPQVFRCLTTVYSQSDAMTVNNKMRTRTFHTLFIRLSLWDAVEVSRVVRCSGSHMS